jgi:hypothetical protein
MTQAPAAMPKPVSVYNRLLLGLIIVLVFAAGVQLYVLSAYTDRFFAWTIAVPLSAAFIGAGFWSAMVPAVLSFTQRYWKDFRPSLPAAVTATWLLLIATLLHLNLFHFSRPEWFPRLAAWVWLIVYLAVPPALGLGWLVQRRLPGQDPAPRGDLPAWLWVVLPSQAAPALAAGAALFVLPQALAPVWAWSLTPLAARAIGAWLFSFGVAAVMILRENDRTRVRGATAGLLAFGLLQLLALVRFAGSVAWATPSAWLYVLYLLSIVVVHAASLLASFLGPGARR